MREGRAVNGRLARGVGRRAARGFVDDFDREFHPEFFRQRQIEPDNFLGNVLDRNARRTFAKQDPRKRFGDGKTGPIITKPHAGQRPAPGDVRIIHHQRQSRVARRLDHGVEALDDRVVALDVDGLHPAADERLGRLEHLARRSHGDFVEFQSGSGEKSARDLNNLHRVGLGGIVNGADGFRARQGLADEIHHVLHGRE